MCREEIIEFLIRSPFKPFRINLADRRSFEVTSPRQLMVTLSAVVVGVGDDLANSIAGAAAKACQAVKAQTPSMPIRFWIAIT